MSEVVTGRVLQFTAGAYRVHVPMGTLECSLSGRAKREAGERVAIGDEVAVERLEDGSSRIVEILPRRTRLARHSLAKRREQVLAANVDQVAVVLSVDRPAPDTRLLDRLLAVAELHGLPALVVLNKMDLAPGHEIPREVRYYAEIGYPVHPTCAKSGAGLDRLWTELTDRTTVFTGPSGVGKSSIVNAMMPGVDLRVGEVGERSGRGRHTTSAGLLIPLPCGGYLADTPGIQHVEPAGADPAELARAFTEFRPLVGRCRFADCRHMEEPGCAVREAVQDGRIEERRHASYVSLFEAADASRDYGS